MTPDERRARFHELGCQRADILAKSGPLRDKRDRHVNAAREKEDKMNADIQQIEAPLFNIDQERATLSRSLSHQTGEPG